MINMIVAVGRYGVIGNKGKLPWRIPEDLKMFKELTMGGVLFVGKKTAESLPPLKGREIVVLTRETFPQVVLAEHHRPKWIIGGAAIYNAALELDIIDNVYLTLIDQNYKGDTYFSTAQFCAPKWSFNKKSWLILQKEPLVELQHWTRQRD